jgi:hypothetical protein
VRPPKGAGFGGIGPLSLQGWAGVAEETAKPLEGDQAAPSGGGLRNKGRLPAGGGGYCR